MINIDKIPIEFSCPHCGFYNVIFFKQARLRDVIICRGCKYNIQLDDQMNECRKAKRRITDAMKEMNKALNDLNLKLEV